MESMDTIRKGLEETTSSGVSVGVEAPSGMRAPSPFPNPGRLGIRNLLC